MGAGLTRAFGAAAATQLSEESVTFLRALSTAGGNATTRELGPQTSQRENSARQRCKRLKLATYKTGCWYLTDVGREALRHSR